MLTHVAWASILLSTLVFAQDPPPAPSQNFSQRGYLEGDLSVFPQTAPNDASHAIGDFIFRWDVAYKAASWLTFSGGIQAEADTHLQTERTLHIDWQDRGLLRPLFELRSFKTTIHKGHVTADIGKQFIRWGTADILNPTDRFAPRDYLSVVDNDFLGVLGGRLVVEGGGTSIDLVVTRFTPSRMPLLNERWTVIPPEIVEPVENAATHFPGGPQFGARLRHVGHAFEISGSYFEGYNHVPLLGVPLDSSPYVLFVERFYPKIRTYGADSAIQLPWFTLKTEAAYFRSRGPQNSFSPLSDDYVLYVAQLERQVKDWTFVAGYAGDATINSRQPLNFDPERGLTRAFLGRANYNIDARRSFAIEFAERQNGAGTWVRGEYTHLLSAHWRATAEAILIAGDDNDFLGQYHRNSHVILKIRYSF